MKTEEMLLQGYDPAVQLFGPAYSELNLGPDSVCVRGWSKDFKAMHDFVALWTTLRRVWPFEQLFLVSDRNMENGDNLRSLEQLGWPEWIIPLSVAGPTEVRHWTRMLNCVPALMKACGITSGKVLNVSFDVAPQLDDFKKAVKGGLDQHVPFIGVRQTPRELCTPLMTAVLDNSERMIEKTVRKSVDFVSRCNVNSKNWSWLESHVQFLRNAFAMWQLEDLIAFKGFGNHANAMGGQEDFDLAMRIWLQYGIAFPKIVRYEDFSQLQRKTQFDEMDVEKRDREFEALQGATVGLSLRHKMAKVKFLPTLPLYMDFEL